MAIDLNESGIPRIERFFDSHTAKAVSIELIPSVAMNESMRMRTTRKALRLPTTTPTSKAQPIATGIDHEASTSPHDTTTALAEIVPAIDRSNTPAASGTSRPRATTKRIAFWLSTERWVNHVSHVSGTQIMNTIQIRPYR